MHWGLVTERRPGPHVTRQNKRCQTPSPTPTPPSLLSHTHHLLSRLKFICCIQMPASNYTSTCGEWARERREGGNGEVTMGHLALLLKRGQHSALIHPNKRSARACVFFSFFLYFIVLLSFCPMFSRSWFWKVKRLMCGFCFTSCKKWSKWAGHNNGSINGVCSPTSFSSLTSSCYIDPAWLFFPLDIKCEVLNSILAIP